MKHLALLVLCFCFLSLAAWGKDEPVGASYAWTAEGPLGERTPAPMDTLTYDYFLKSIPSAVSPAYATTGNMGAEGLEMLYFRRESTSNFFFRDALRHWIPQTTTFFNTRIPMTLLSFNTGGGKEDSQDRLKMTFSGNAGPRWQVGANLDYIYSKGSYNYQATKDLIWGFSTSYIGDRYQMQAYWNHWNMLNKENGGITDDLYITDPEELQGGVSSVNCKTIPTNLTAAHTRVVGGDFKLANRYNVGFWKETKEGDSVVAKEYVPATAFSWVMTYQEGRHVFKNTANEDFWAHHYMDASETYDKTTFWTLRNTLGVELLEGFNKYAKASLALFLTHEIRKYVQAPDTLSIAKDQRPGDLSSYPFTQKVLGSKTESDRLWAGAQLIKRQGRLINYNVIGEIGVLGGALGETKITGDLTTHFRLLKDSVALTAFGFFKNEAVPYLLQHYTSNHFIWENDFSKVRRLRLGGRLHLERTNTWLEGGVENVQNLVYFNSEALPEQCSSSIQVISLALRQNFQFGILHWNNDLTFQTSSKQEVLPLPKFAIYSNLYLWFKVAKVLDVQLGVNCDYYTRYKAMNYQPALASFYTDPSQEVGNFPFVNVYANMKLSRTRFYVVYSHLNASMGTKNYFSLPHYPLNPARLQFGLAVDFRN